MIRDLWSFIVGFAGTFIIIVLLVIFVGCVITACIFIAKVWEHINAPIPVERPGWQQPEQSALILNVKDISWIMENAAVDSMVWLGAGDYDAGSLDTKASAIVGKGKKKSTITKKGKK